MNQHSKILAETALWVGVGTMVYDAFKAKKQPAGPSMWSVVDRSHHMSNSNNKGDANCVYCRGTWSVTNQTYSTSLESYCHARDLPLPEYNVTVSPDEWAFWSDFRKYGCQKAGELQEARKRAAKALAVAARPARKPKFASPAQPPQPVHIRREDTGRVEDVAAITALKPLAQTDLMDLLVRLRVWLVYWEV